MKCKFITSKTSQWLVKNDPYSMSIKGVNLSYTYSSYPRVFFLWGKWKRRRLSLGIATGHDLELLTLSAMSLAQTDKRTTIVCATKILVIARNAIPVDIKVYVLIWKGWPCRWGHRSRSRSALLTSMKGLTSASICVKFI